MNPAPHRKRCSHCKKILPVDDFVKNSSKPDGLSNNCRECHCKSQKNYARKQKRRKNVKIPRVKECNICHILKRSSEFVRDKSRRDWLLPHCKICAKEKQLIRKYKITLGQWEDMFNKQGKKCAICGNNVTSKIGWVVDHNHKTGKNRAILCDHCNRMLGYAKENQNTLIAAADYLKRDELS